VINVVVDRARVKELSLAVQRSGKKLKKELAIAVNATSRFVKKQSAKEIGKELSTAQKNIAAVLAITQKAKAEGEHSNPKATVRVKKTGKIPLRDYGARQTKKGVSYKISKTKGRRMATGAFQGPKPGVMKASWRGRVFQRVGKSRLPIVQLFGPSPWGVFAIKKLKPPVMAAAKAELNKQVKRRIRFIKLKQSGVI
jgi:hypothetical protein